MSTVRANNYYDASGGSNAQLYGVASPPNSMGFRNRIINGDMRIDQRNAGASGTANNAYTVDRWAYYGNQASKGTWGQNLNSVTPPAGFKNYLGFQSSSAYSVLTGDEFEFYQRIEGYNVADLGWGAAGASTITFSFWVRSSLTGTFGGSLRNAGATRSYPFTYTISSANTWEYKTVTVAGDTTGTWPTDNSTGLTINFSLGVGSTLSGAAGSWAGANFVGATGQVNVVGTNGATFYITGVQLEAGTVASPFQRVEYGEMLRACQRYFEMSFSQGTAPATNTAKSQSVAMTVGTISGVEYTSNIKYSVLKRATPTLTFFNPNVASNTMRIYGSVGSAGDFTPTINSQSDNGYNLSYARTGDTIFEFHWTAAAEL